MAVAVGGTGVGIAGNGVDEAAETVAVCISGTGPQPATSMRPSASRSSFRLKVNPLSSSA